VIIILSLDAPKSILENIYKKSKKPKIQKTQTNPIKPTGLVLKKLGFFPTLPAGGPPALLRCRQGRFRQYWRFQRQAQEIGGPSGQNEKKAAAKPGGHRDAAA
jgi:hypothetical protein